MIRKASLAAAFLLVLAAVSFAAAQFAAPRVGKQSDGSFIVSTEQRVVPAAIAFDGRPTDIAMHPSGRFFAILNQKSVLLATRQGVIPDSSAPLKNGAGFHGLAWSPDGTRLYASVSDGFVESFDLSEQMPDASRAKEHEHTSPSPSPRSGRPGEGRGEVRVPPPYGGRGEVAFSEQKLTPRARIDLRPDDDPARARRQG